MSRVLVVAVHPDDETLGCGGTLLRHKAEGDSIHWLIITAMAVQYGFKEEAVRHRCHEIEAVNAAYGFNGMECFNLPPTQVDTMPMGELVSRLTEIFNRWEPQILYLPFHADVHSDHRTVFQAAMSGAKTFRKPFLKRILMMETVSETDLAPSLGHLAFHPNVFVDVTPYLLRKIEIMKLYGREWGEHPFPRSPRGVESLAVLRGAAGGYEYAESFMLLKERR